MDRFRFRVRDENGKLVEEKHYVLTQSGSIMACTDRRHRKDWTVEMCTGEKSEGGKGPLMFESDKIKATALFNDHGQRGAIETAVIVFHQGCFCLSLGKHHYVPLLNFLRTSRLEIVGNIHEVQNGSR